MRILAWQHRTWKVCRTFITSTSSVSSLTAFITLIPSSISYVFKIIKINLSWWEERTLKWDFIKTLKLELDVELSFKPSKMLSSQTCSQFTKGLFFWQTEPLVEAERVQIARAGTFPPETLWKVKKIFLGDHRITFRTHFTIVVL